MDVVITPEEASDGELSELLYEAYVGDGHTSPEVAAQVFEPRAVRARGTLLCARDETGALRGVVVLVESGAAAAKLAREGELELHLLAVAKAARGRGIGRMLVTACIAEAQRRGATRLLLWTQPRMLAAQALYHSSGFVRLPECDFTLAERSFLVFEKTLDSR